VADVLAAGVEVAGALATVHARGVYHRDIKPQNLFVSDFGSVALGDFGISSFDDERSTTGTGALTVHYAPPELIEGESASAQSDVYSLAASLYALMSGERPYPRGPGQSVGDLARRILYEPVPRVDRPDVPDSLAELLHAAMAKRPDDRPASAAEFGTELQRVQLELGLAVTPMRLPDGPSVIEPTPITFAPPPPQVPLVGRRVTSAALGVLAVVAIGATAIAVTATDPPVSEAPTRPAAPAPAAGSDSFFAAPTTPSSITATRIDSTTVEVSWALSDRAVAYEVVPVGADAVSVPAPPVTLEADARPVCVIVRAIGDGGRLSADSDPVCSD
jgi:serine/threonine protein kinase